MGYKDILFPKDSKFLVTGGAGFIGSNLCEALLEMGYSVRCLDNLSTGSQSNVDIFIDNSLYEFVLGDIRDFDTCMKACEGIDYILHQAAWGSVPRSIEMPILYEEINIKGTLNMLEAARLNKVQKFVYASSSSVYGDDQTLPKVEGIEGNALSPYALTKKVNEEYARLYSRLFKLDTCGLRYFNVFGKRQNPNGVYAAVIPKFISKILKDERPVINGDGYQSRDFTYIENVIEANLRACRISSEESGEVFNIANGSREYLIDVFNYICKVLGTSIEPIFTEVRAGDIKHSNADISKARAVLFYDPCWDFAKGIDEAIQWYKENLK